MRDLFALGEFFFFYRGEVVSKSFETSLRRPWAKKNPNSSPTFRSNSLSLYSSSLDRPPPPPKKKYPKKIKRYWLEVAGVDVVARTPNAPTAARLSYGGGNDAPNVQVTWQTRDVIAGSKVDYGTSPQALTSSVLSTPDSSYFQSLFCAAPARFLPAEAEVVPLLQPTSEGGAFLTGTINNAVLTGLAPDTR